ncbi:hypothetical protein [Streptomyces tremellae]|uniref:Restriction endonuclease type IV Mrr domain-containing protein n=1 Tax=Streptomyces tremellae TaxID=1124239 RepID=A0ABP7EVJ4_9ACTN
MEAQRPVGVDCPVCGRRHRYAPPAYACACGAPVVPPLCSGARPEPVPHRSRSDEWVLVRCPACGREGHWPQPRLGCPCGTVLRIPVQPAAPQAPALPPGGQAGPPHIPLPRTAAAPRPSFRPLTIRTARDAVTAAGLYLRWLGFHGVAAERRPESGVDLRGPEVVARVDPTTSRTTLRAVERVWLYGRYDTVAAVVFSLAGYTEGARARADGLGVPLFVMDLTGTPQPVNGAADELVSSEQ